MSKKFGDRKDAKLIRNIDSMHFIMAQIYPNRADNEAFVSERIDLTNTEKYLAKLNEQNPEYKYNLFQLIVTAMLKTIILRPKMNRFIANKNFYQRNDVSASFIIKKIFADNSEEGMACIRAKSEDTFFTIHDDIYRQVSACRNEKKGSTDESMDLFNKLPHFISKTAISFVRFLDRHGKVPQSLIDTDPFYCSVVLSNLGSIKLQSGYHHLTNWGTTSLFCIVGEKKMRPVFDEKGNYEMKMTVDLGLTVDERIADGYYYSKTVKILKHLLENPELLEQPLGNEVEI
ncbi:MAG: 2-oxo acid dehydrogenase subunit E2 [Clostridiales bacterium]|nr:2-oxo acid dehydrogenase subunit E2 [Candidatus Equinaster intestinalis]